MAGGTEKGRKEGIKERKGDRHPIEYLSLILQLPEESNFISLAEHIIGEVVQVCKDSRSL